MTSGVRRSSRLVSHHGAVVEVVSVGILCEYRYDFSFGSVKQTL